MIFIGLTPSVNKKEALQSSCRGCRAWAEKREKEDTMNEMESDAVIMDIISSSASAGERKLSEVAEYVNSQRLLTWIDSPK